MTGRTWGDNAAEFALLDRGEGWPFARLVACSVEKNGQGRPQKRDDRSFSAKVTADEFAERAGTSRPRVLRYLEAWDKAAADGLCREAAELVPNDATTVMEPDAPWEKFYDARKAGGRPRDSKAEDAAVIIERRGAAAVVETLTPTVRAEVRKALGGPTKEEVIEVVRSDPKARRETKAAIAEEDHREYEEAVRAGGGNPDLPPEPFNGELAAEASRISGVLIGLRSRVRRLRGRCEGDQWEKVRPMIEEGLATLTSDLYGSVPDTIEELLQ